MNVIVIGAGVAGLAAAYDLAKRGHHVDVYEASDRAGGQVRTFEVGGGRVEIFYHHLFRSDTTIVDLIDELGLGDDLLWIDSNVGLHARGRNYPFVGPLDLLRFDRVSLLTRIRLGLGALYLRRYQHWRNFEGKRAAEWIRRWVGREGYDAVWGPLLRAKFRAHAEDVSLVWFWGKLHLRFASRQGGGVLGGLLAKEQLGYLRGSFGRLIDALVGAIGARGGTIHLQAPVERVLIEEGRVQGIRLRDGAEVRADAVLATVPSEWFTRMVPDLDQRDARYAEMLRSVRYQWATVLAITLERPLSPIYWLTMTEDDCPFVVAVEQTNFMPPSEYGGEHLLYLSNYVDPGDPTTGQTADEVFERYAPYLQRINPAFDRSWVREKWLFTDRAGQPVVHARYHETIPPHRTPVAGLYLANTTQIYPEDRGQNYSIRMGQRVARLLEADAATQPIAAAEAGRMPWTRG
ncbi:MAG: NAD(P)/FAD-dependent oxidoreductase [Chloroflexi bacterium]|nr:NAD(P)/FAD-dependent oxidoreductase [Chloroflexota bacterium]